MNAVFARMSDEKRIFFNTGNYGKVIPLHAIRGPSTANWPIAQKSAESVQGIYGVNLRFKLLSMNDEFLHARSKATRYGLLTYEETQ